MKNHAKGLGFIQFGIVVLAAFLISRLFFAQ